MLADVAQSGRAEQGVDHGVGEHVGIRVAEEAPVVLQPYAAEDERPAGSELVTVVADAGGNAHATSLAPSHSSASARSAAVVTLKFGCPESSTRTVPPCCSTSQAASVACASSASSARPRSSALLRKTCGVWTAQSPTRCTVRATTPSLAS